MTAPSSLFGSRAGSLGRGEEARGGDGLVARPVAPVSRLVRLALRLVRWVLALVLLVIGLGAIALVALRVLNYALVGTGGEPAGNVALAMGIVLAVGVVALLGARRLVR